MIPSKIFCFKVRFCSSTQNVSCVSRKYHYKNKSVTFRNGSVVFRNYSGRFRYISVTLLHGSGSFRRCFVTFRYGIDQSPDRNSVLGRLSLDMYPKRIRMLVKDNCYLQRTAIEMSSPIFLKQRRNIVQRSSLVKLVFILQYVDQFNLFNLNDSQQTTF